MKKYKFLYAVFFLLFTMGIKTLFHGFPDIERFFSEWMDERLTLTIIMKFGTLNFAPTEIWHPPLYHYLTFIPIAAFFIIGRLLGFFHDKIDLLRFYFNNTHYFFFIGRMMSYAFYWLSAIMIYKIIRLYYDRSVSYITVLSYLLVPRFIFDFSTTRPETLLFLNTAVFFYFFLRYYLDPARTKYLFLSAFFLGVSIATKYNAVYLGLLFIFLIFFKLRNYKLQQAAGVLLKSSFFIFLGFFICNPFFILNFRTYFYNLKLYGVEAKYYWKETLYSNHLAELSSLMYLNIFGVLILFLGVLNMIKRDRKLLLAASFVILMYEIYFGVFFNNFSPLRYLNPLLPIAALIFGAGIDFIKSRKRYILIAVVFLSVSFYNYCDIWLGMTVSQTYLQKARLFIEENISEKTVLCITTNHNLPQLNMTEEAYYYLMDTSPLRKNIEGHELSYKDMDDEKRYSADFKKLRVQSLTKNPQYNFIRWDIGMETEADVADFLKKNNVGYILSDGPWRIGNKRLEDTKIASLAKEFKPYSHRIHAWTEGLFLYKVN
jgi:hypothetical protein